jgi:hypothetical protein
MYDTLSVAMTGDLNVLAVTYRVARFVAESRDLAIRIAFIGEGGRIHADELATQEPSAGKSPTAGL